MLEAHRCPGFHQGDLFHRSLGSFRGHPIGSAHPAGGARRLCGQITTALPLPRQPLQAGPHDLEFLWMLPSFARINGLVHGKSTGNRWILRWNIGCSYKLSLEPIQWNKGKILQLCFIEFDEWRCYFLLVLGGCPIKIGCLRQATGINWNSYNASHWMVNIFASPRAIWWEDGNGPSFLNWIPPYNSNIIVHTTHREWLV